MEIATNTKYYFIGQPFKHGKNWSQVIGQINSNGERTVGNVYAEQKADFADTFGQNASERTTEAKFWTLCPNPHYKTISAIKAENQAAGFYFFSRSTMKFFGSKIEPKIYAGRYFITSEQPPHGRRKFSARLAMKSGNIETVQPSFCDTREEARELIFAHYRANPVHE